VIAERVYHCETCGDPFQPKRRDARYCGATCRQRACRNRHSANTAGFGDVVLDLWAKDEIDTAEAILLLVYPPAKVRERLEVAA
jgi:hypothetical protein